jgi:hypothetical protein
VIELETIFHIFHERDWPPSWWAERGINVGGYHDTNGGYEFLIIGAHNHRRTDEQYGTLLNEAERLGEKYGMAVIRASEVFPPHEGIIWNGLCKDNAYPNNFTTENSNETSKIEFVNRVKQVENEEHHSLSVILHPQAGGSRNTLESAIEMVREGAELIEIFNGGWESGDDLRVNDHKRTGSTNTDKAPACGNSENMWDEILSRGHRVWGIGCDDFHGYRKEIDTPKKSHKYAGNYCWIEVLTKSPPEAEEIVRAIEMGSFYVTQGVQILEVKVVGDTIKIVGDETVDFIEAIGQTGGEVALNPVNQGLGDSGTLLTSVEGNIIEYKQDPECPYDDTYVRFRLVNTDYDERYYYDEHGDGGGDVYAWTQPFFLRKPPDTS